MHGTSFHSVLGYAAVKHPFLGAGVRDKAARQASMLCAVGGRVVADGEVDVVGGCVAAAGGAGAGAGSWGRGASFWAEAAKKNKSPDNRPALIAMLSPLVTRPRAKAGEFDWIASIGASRTMIKSRPRWNAARRADCDDRYG